MKSSKKKNEQTKLEQLTEWILYFIGFTLVIMGVSKIFKSVYIDQNHFILYSALIVCLIQFLNKTLKPILFTITIPIIGITLGLFYPIINLFILKLADWILGGLFDITNIFVALLAAIILSIMNLFVENLVKKIMKRVRKNG